MGLGYPSEYTSGLIQDNPTQWEQGQGSVSSVWGSHGHGEAPPEVTIRLRFCTTPSDHIPGGSPYEGAYDLKTDNDIMEMRVGGALFITVTWLCNCKENPNSTLRDVELMLFPVIDRERPLNRAKGRTSCKMHGTNSHMWFKSARILLLRPTLRTANPLPSSGMSGLIGTFIYFNP